MGQAPPPPSNASRSKNEETVGKAFDVYTKNAYRILGLCGAASCNEVAEAASALRRANKIGKTKDSLWDLDWLGHVSRTNGDIQNQKAS